MDMISRMLNPGKAKPIIPNTFAHKAPKNYFQGFVKLKWSPNNVKMGVVPNKPGIYVFWDGFGQLLYVGHASRLRHRLQSYYQKDGYHNTKDWLRNLINLFGYRVMPEMEARQLEKEIKKYAKYNYR